MASASVWPVLGTTVTLASGFVITAAGAVALLDDEIVNLIQGRKLLTFDPTALNPNPSPIPPSAQGGATTVASQAAASSATGLSNNALVVTQGQVSPADVSGGHFFLDLSSSATIDGGLTLAAAGGVGRLRRIRDRSFINVKWFGAKGDGSTDDTAAIQAAIDAASVLMAPSSNPACDVYVPPGNYMISATLRCYRTAGCGNLRIVGADTAGSNLSASTFFWNGTSYVYNSNPVLEAANVTRVPMFWATGNDMSFENFAIKSSGFKVLYSGIEVGSTTTTAATITHNKFKGICVVGNSNSPIYQGVTMGSLFPQNSNLENFVFEDCYFDTLTVPTAPAGYGVNIASGQPINTSFMRCHFTDSPGANDKSMHGIFVQAPSATVTMTDCDFQSLEVGVNTYNGSMNIGVNGGEAENCKKLFYGAGFAVGVSGSIAIRDMRLNPGQINATTRNFSSGDRYYIDARAGGGVSIDNCYFTNGPGDTTLHPLVRVNQRAPLRVHNCDFCDVLPFVVTADYGVLTAGIFANSNRYYLLDGSELIPLPAYTGGLNPSGTVTITGAATNATVTLPTSELDTSYKVRLSVEGITAGGVVGNVWADTKTATTFVANVSAAPTVGKTLTIRYEIYR